MFGFFILLWWVYIMCFWVGVGFGFCVVLRGFGFGWFCVVLCGFGLGISVCFGCFGFDLLVGVVFGVIFGFVGMDGFGGLCGGCSLLVWFLLVGWICFGVRYFVVWVWGWLGLVGCVM